MRIPKAFRPASRSERLVELSDFTRYATGKFRDKEVAKLLNVTAIALNQDIQFDAFQIAQARSRQKKP
jgi:hypothetical protein